MALNPSNLPPGVTDKMIEDAQAQPEGAVKRYNLGRILYPGGIAQPNMDESASGMFVLASDYDALSSQLAQAQKETSIMTPSDTTEVAVKRYIANRLYFENSPEREELINGCAKVVLASDYEGLAGEVAAVKERNAELHAQLVEARERIDLIASQANRLNDEKNAAASQLAAMQERAGKLAELVEESCMCITSKPWEIGIRETLAEILSTTPSPEGGKD